MADVMDVDEEKIDRHLDEEEGDKSSLLESFSLEGIYVMRESNPEHLAAINEH